MKIIHKDNLPNISLPLPIYHSVHIADAIAKDGAEFDIFIGLPKQYVEQLKKLSLDKSDAELQDNTGDRERFGKGSYEEWYNKNRTPFSLVHKQNDTLAALVWFGPRPLFTGGNNWHTIGWRAYKPFRGKGLMKVFTQFSIDFYKENVPNIKLWIASEKDNLSSRKLAQDLGFQVSEEVSEDNSIIMVKE